MRAVPHSMLTRVASCMSCTMSLHCQHPGDCMSRQSSLLIMKASLECSSAATMSATAASVPWCMWHWHRAPSQCQTPGTQPPCSRVHACVVPAVSTLYQQIQARIEPLFNQPYRAVVSEQRFCAQTEAQYERCIHHALTINVCQHKQAKHDHHCRQNAACRAVRSRNCTSPCRRQPQ